jgi:hypothetical protein
MAEVEEQEPAEEAAVEAEPVRRSGVGKEPMVIVSGKGIGRKKVPLSEYQRMQEEKNAKS